MSIEQKRDQYAHGAMALSALASKMSSIATSLDDAVNLEGEVKADLLGLSSTLFGEVTDTPTDDPTDGGLSPVGDADDDLVVVDVPDGFDPVSDGLWVDFTPMEYGRANGLSNDGQYMADWNKQFGISGWNQGHYANGKLLYTNVQPQADGTVILKVDAQGSAELQQHKAKVRKGRFGVIANMGDLRKGLISVPLWCYSGYVAGGPSFEFDVEFTGNSGFDITYHDRLRTGKKYVRVDGDFSGEDFKIEYDFDIDAGYCKVIINDELLHTFTKEQVEADGFKWVDKPMFPIYMAWAYNNDWAGGNFDMNAPAYELVLKKRFTDV